MRILTSTVRTTRRSRGSCDTVKAEQITRGKGLGNPRGVTAASTSSHLLTVGY